MTPPKVTRCAEGRGRLKRTPSKSTKVRTQSRVTLPCHLVRVNEAARRDKHTQFTALLHHVNVDALARAFRRLKRSASAGVDGETVASYEQNLQEKLQDLCDQIHTGRYRAQPVRRVYIPKSDGGRRPIGIPTLEDKIVQGATAELLSSIYEADFLGFSYGFRPRRGPHHALKALHTALMSQKVNWVLDADIRSFFDSVDHEWMLRMVAHRVTDRRVLCLVRKWLKAGVLEKKEWKETKQGTPQGSGISPILANIFLHYVLDQWVHRWRQRNAQGRVIVVRYCDDFVMAFQYESDARRLLVDLKERLAKFKLTLHEGKTRLIEFGKLPSERRERSGKRRCETFAFLGFTHYCAKTRDGRFIVKRKTESKRMALRLKELRVAARRRMHAPVADQHRWLSSVLRGHYAYYGLPSNFQGLTASWRTTRRIWFRSLKRRSQRCHLTWVRYAVLLEHFPLPSPRITHSREALSVRVG